MDEQREALLKSRLLVVKAQLQSEGGVIHIVTRKAMD